MELLFDLLFERHSWQLGAYVVLSMLGTLVGIFHIPSVLLRRSERPMAQLAWILCLVTIPYLGVLLWWMMGRTYLKRRKRKRLRAVADMSRDLTSMRESMSRDASTPSDEQTDTLLSIDSDEIFSSTAANSVGLLFRGSKAYDSIEEAVRRATDHVHFEFYIWQDDETGRRFRDLLVEKAEEGLEVRVLYDAVGASQIRGDFMKPLIDAGAQIEAFLPVVIFERRLRINFRNHRKIIVVDSEYGFTGGMNIGDEYLDWFDVAFRFEGPVVNQLQEVFAEDWYYATGENLAERRYFNENEADPYDDESGLRTDAVVRILPSGPDQKRNLVKTSVFVALALSRERAWVTTPYFIPDSAISMALQSAALRGVDVRLMLPGLSDIAVARIASRGYYEELLEAGVKIYEYQPEVLHAKMMIVDDEWSIVGSANLDIRSFQLNFEANAVIKSKGIVRDIEELMRQCLEHSEAIHLESFQQRSTWEKLKESAARLFSPLL